MIYWSVESHLGQVLVAAGRDAVEGRVLAGGEGTQLVGLLLRYLETSGAKNRVDFCFLLISVESGELPLILMLLCWARVMPVAGIAPSRAGSSS